MQCCTSRILVTLPTYTLYLYLNSALHMYVDIFTLRPSSLQVNHKGYQAYPSRNEEIPLLCAFRRVQVAAEFFSISRF
jgi:hypothetical protein